MKDIIIKHKVVFSLIAILVIVFIIIKVGNSIVPAVAPSATSTPVSSTGNTTGSKPSGTTVTPGTTVAPVTTKPAVTSSAGFKITISKETNYEAYMEQLGINTTKCNNFASALYMKTYEGVLGSANYFGRYNPETGQCYLEVSGIKRTVDSFDRVASTTYNLYFRNALTGSLLAECVMEGATVTNESQFICTDKVTGKRVSKTQYDNLLASYK